MPEYIGVSGVARMIKDQNVGVAGVARKVISGYIGVSGVARKFYGETATAITNFKKTSKAYNYIYFSWTNPSSNYTGVRIQAQTGSQPATVSTGTNVYHGVGTKTTAGATNTSGKVSLSITSRTSTTYYFSAFAYYVKDGQTYYSNTYSTDNAALVCYDCSSNCGDCCDGDCRSVCNECTCNTVDYCTCDTVSRCNPWDSAAGDCGAVFEETSISSKTEKEYDCSECGTCSSDCSDYPSCGNVSY